MDCNKAIEFIKNSEKIELTDALVLKHIEECASCKKTYLKYKGVHELWENDVNDYSENPAFIKNLKEKLAEKPIILLNPGIARLFAAASTIIFIVSAYLALYFFNGNIETTTENDFYFDGITIEPVENYLLTYQEEVNYETIK